MNREKEIKEAKKWTKKGGAYVKAIYGDGENGLMVSGDMVALLRITDRIITRIGDISGEGFISTWLAVREIHKAAEEIGVKTETLNRGVMMPYKKGGEEE